MWFPMQVGSDERRYAWQDEGLTRFNQAQGMQAFFKGYDREKAARESYLSIAGSDDEQPLMTEGDLYATRANAYQIATYDKMATNMIALRGLLGDSTFRQSYRTYGLRWHGKHPTPYDFFYGFNALGGQNLSWFWRTWWYETWTLDQAIASVEPEGLNLRVTVEDKGMAPMPVRLTISRTGATPEQTTIQVDAFLHGARRASTIVPNAATVTAIEIDAQQRFPDIDRSNNRWVKR